MRDAPFFTMPSMLLFETQISRQALVALLLIFWAGCSKDFADNPSSNQPPKTFLSVFSSNQLNPTTSRQTFHWWGDDPDGTLSGFIYTFNKNAESVQQWDSSNPAADWIFTSETEETFVLSLGGNDTLYTFWVKAVDDQGATDPQGATQDFTIVNSRPSVEFPVGTDVPDTTFTVANFVWRGTDQDGDDSIARYEYVLDDTTDPGAWLFVDSKQSSITLTEAEGLTEGDHTLYLRAVDIAGAMSRIISMPRTPTEHWYVKRPQSNFLIIDDYNVADNTDTFLQSQIRAIVGTVDIWNIKSNGGALEPPSSIAFTQTLALFDKVFWYADPGPNLEKAQASIPAYLEGGGKVLMSTSFQEFSSNQGDPLDFSPVDSLGLKITRLTRNQLIHPDSSLIAEGLPELQVNVAIIPNVFPLSPKVTSRVLYRLPEDAGWQGRPAMAVVDAQDTFIFFGLPLASLNAQQTVPQLLEKLILMLD